MLPSPQQHQHEKRHQHASHKQIDAALGETIEAYAVERAHPVEHQRRQRYPREVAVEPIVVAAGQDILRQIACQSRNDEPHHHPRDSTLRQIPREENLQRVGIEDDGIDHDGRRKDEVDDDLQDFRCLALFVFITADKRHAHERCNEKPQELIDIRVEIMGFLDSEDVEERPRNRENGQIEDSRHQHTERQLCDHVQQMCSEGPVGQPVGAYDEQQCRQHVGKREC